MEAKSPSLRKNPSRETCEGIIRRILMTEVLEKGKNEHFRTAADFMKYFESLYPASDALTKQVQRAIRSLNMPKDELGYFIPNKTAEQLAQEQELTYIFKKESISDFLTFIGTFSIFFIVPVIELIQVDKIINVPIPIAVATNPSRIAVDDSLTSLCALHRLVNAFSTCPFLQALLYLAKLVNNKPSLDFCFFA